MTDTTIATRRARRWAGHDASIPYKDERLVRLNGTNRAGRRPHALMEPQLLRPANDNAEERRDAA